jgi:D-alanine-D-alanine ligase
MSRTINLSVACLLDRDNLGQITRARTTNSSARYDLTVVQTLRRLYREVKLVSVSKRNLRWIDELRHGRPDVAFNLTFSATPLEASMAGCLDMLGIAYTGSGPQGIALANDKIRSRHVLRAAGIRVPQFVVLAPNRPVVVELPLPLIVKPSMLAASVGIYADSVVRHHSRILSLAKRIWHKYNLDAVCEEFIVGREFRVGLVEEAGGHNRVVAISEWLFGSAVSGWGFKTEAIRNNPRVRRARNVTRSLASISRSTSAKIADIARRSMKVLDVRGYATVDIRVDDLGRATVLEVNANPGLWSGGAIWSTPSFDFNIRRIVRAALRRARE